MQAARKAVRTSVERGFTALLLGGLLAFAFLGGQFYAWGQVRESEFFSPVNPAVAFFYLLTAVHGTCSAACMSGDELSPACAGRRRNDRPARHQPERRVVRRVLAFLLLVWLGLFTVMLST